MKFWSLEFIENRFGFLGNDGSCCLEGKKLIESEELQKMNIVIFVSSKFLEVVYNKMVELGETNFKPFYCNGKINGIYALGSKTLYRNFDNICSEGTNLESIKEDFELDGNNAEVMCGYVEQILKTFHIQRRQVAAFNISGILECVTYRGLSNKVFKISNNELPKLDTEREIVFDYFKKSFLKEHNKKEVYGVLDCKIGHFENVLMIDLGNYYGFLLCTQKYLKGNPYQILSGRKEPEYDLIPMELRKVIISNYMNGNKKENGKYKLSKGLRRMYKGATNMTIGRSENKEIYMNRNKSSVKSYLQPQHGFATISHGIKIMELYTNYFKEQGNEIICRDTDSIKMVVKDKDKAIELVNEINQNVVRILLNCGFTEEEANCGIGQFKIEGLADEYYQFGDKQYCYRIGNEFGITCSGLERKVQKEIIKRSDCFETLVESIKMNKKDCIFNLNLGGKKDYGF